MSHTEPTDAELIAAIENSKIGFAVIVTQGEDVQMINVQNPALVTAGEVEDHLRALFGPAASFAVFDLIG